MVDALTLSDITEHARQQHVIVEFLRSRGEQWTRLSALVDVDTPFGHLGRAYDDLRLLERAGLIECSRRMMQLGGRRRAIERRYYRAVEDPS